MIEWAKEDAMKAESMRALYKDAVEKNEFQYDIWKSYYEYEKEQNAEEAEKIKILAREILERDM